MLKKREPATSGDVGLSISPESGELLRLWPTVVEFLCSSKWADGSTRLTGTVMFMTEGPTWKAWVHDRDGKVSTFVSGPTLTSLLVSLDKGLADDSLDWRPDRPAGKGQARRA